MTVLETVSEITAKQHNTHRSGITPETHFFNDFCDSMDIVEIIMACEEVFGIDISDVDFTANKLETIGRLATFIEAKLKSQPP